MNKSQDFETRVCSYMYSEESDSEPGERVQREMKKRKTHYKATLLHNI